MKNLGSALLLLASLSLMLAAPVAYGSPPIQANGTATFIPGSVINTTTADGNTIITYNFVEVDTGTFVGTRVGVERDVIHPDGTATFHGVGTFTGTVDGRAGTATLIAQGTYSVIVCGPGTTSGSFVFMAGTGGLATLRGQGSFVGDSCTPTVAYSG